MGVKGPIPKRSEERRRRNKPKTPTDTVDVVGAVVRPPANARWHRIAKDLYASLADSGQVKFYEPSDWALAYLLCDTISRDLNPQVVGVNKRTGRAIRATVPVSGASIAAWLSGLARLGVSEGDRRRMGLEIRRGAPDVGKPANVTAMDDYRSALGG